MASIPDITHASHNEQLEKLKAGSTSFQLQEAARGLTIHRSSLSASAPNTLGRQEEAAVLSPLTPRVLLPPWLGRWDRGKAGPSPGPLAASRVRRARLADARPRRWPGAAIGGSAWNSMTSRGRRGEGRGLRAVLAPVLPARSLSPAGRPEGTQVFSCGKQGAEQGCVSALGLHRCCPA